MAHSPQAKELSLELAFVLSIVQDKETIGHSSAHHLINYPMTSSNRV